MYNNRLVAWDDRLDVSPSAVSGESRKPGGLAEFQEAVASLMHVWNDQVATNDDHSPIPVFLDLLSGPNYPLSQAFCWAGWKVVQPIDLQIDRDFDITNSSVQRAIAHILPTCHLVSTAMDCSTKSRIREIALPGLRAPKPFGVSNIQEVFLLCLRTRHSGLTRIIRLATSNLQFNMLCILMDGVPCVKIHVAVFTGLIPMKYGCIAKVVGMTSNTTAVISTQLDGKPKLLGTSFA